MRRKALQDFSNGSHQKKFENQCVRLLIAYTIQLDPPASPGRTTSQLFPVSNIAPAGFVDFKHIVF